MVKIKKRSVILNIVTSLLLQIVTVISGFILPKIVLSNFGSQANGLVSSISQFLGYITLLEGGVSGVVLSSLYKPLSKKDFGKVSGILKATEQFFKNIASIYAIYCIVVAIIYPLVKETGFSFGYVFSLTLIVGATSFIQYMFSLSYRLLLRADRCSYVVSLSHIVFIILNIILSVISIKIYPSMHFLKIVNVAAFILQPIIYRIYVRRNYPLIKDIQPDNDALEQRWDGFGQNLAYFIHTNTDIVILTVFSTLLDVSVYAVYSMIAVALKNLVLSISSPIVPSVGTILASEDDEIKNSTFDLYELIIGFITTFLFVCAIILAVPFVRVYTSGISDANYIQPFFAVVLLLSEAVYCYREPYINVVYASGHFKQSAKYAYTEAIMNIVISLALVKKFGLNGIVTGTCISMIYRMIAHVVYIRKNILFRSVSKFLKNTTMFAITGFCVVLIFRKLILTEITTYYQWFMYATLVGASVLCTLIAVMFLFNRKGFLNLTKRILKK